MTWEKLGIHANILTFPRVFKAKGLVYSVQVPREVDQEAREPRAGVPSTDCGIGYMN